MQSNDNSDARYRNLTIDILRHGECDDGHRYRGKRDVALSQRGQQQMRASVSRIEAPWTCVVTSPLQRCTVIAQDIASQRNIPILVEKDFEEIDFGDWDGENMDDVWKAQQPLVEQWFADPVAFPPPNGERADVFSQRVVAAMDAHIAHLSVSHSHLLVVAHGGVVRALVAHCLSIPLQKIGQLAVPYACVSRLGITYDVSLSVSHYQLIAHNIGAIA